MPRVSWTTPARDDLRAINDWLIDETTPQLAVRVLGAIRARATKLQQFPHIGRPHGDSTRILRVFDTPYLIRYRLIAGEVQVLRVHHERENWFVEP